MEFNSGRLTEGSVTRTLIRFAVPYLLANFIQALYGAVDMAVIGWFSDAAAIAAVSVGTQIMQSLQSLISGLTLGSTILIAQYIGARRERETGEIIGTTLTLFGLCAVFFTAVMLLCAHPLLRALQTPPEAMGEAVRYVLVASCGILFIFGYNALSAVLRGVGDSARPLFFIAAACVLNILLDLLFVGALRWGAAGAAGATILSQALSLALAVIHLGRRNFLFQFKAANFKIRRAHAVRLIKLGLPVSLQETMVTVSFLFITAIINAIGVNAAAAAGVCGKFESFAMLPASAFSGALSAIAGQNIGAGRPDRAKQSLKMSILLAFCCSLFFFAWAQLAPGSILRLFRADEAVTLAGSGYLRSFSFDFMLVAFVFTFNGFFNGCGRTLYTCVVGVAASVGVRLPLTWLFARLFPASMAAIGASVPLASVVSIIAGLWYLRSGRWKPAEDKECV